MRRSVANAIGWLANSAAPKHPAGAGTGELTPLVEYVAIYLEGEALPAVVVVMRFPVSAQGSLSSISSSLRTKGDQTPHQIRLTSGQRAIACSLDAATRTLALQGHRIPLGQNNLVLCDIAADNELARSSVSLAAVTYGAHLRGFEAETELLSMSAIRDFLASAV